MARRSRVSMQKRQRELRKADKAAKKRAKRHGLPEEESSVLNLTAPTVGVVTVPAVGVATVPAVGAAAVPAMGVVHNGSEVSREVDREKMAEQDEPK